MSRFIITSEAVRGNALLEVRLAPIGHVVSIGPRKRSLDQNAHFHALCDDLAKSGLKWAGKNRNEDEWKAIMVSGHAVATGSPGEVIPGNEGEFVAIRESTSRMTVARAASLIEYVMAFCVGNNIPLIETRKGGYVK